MIHLGLATSLGYEADSYSEKLGKPIQFQCMFCQQTCCSIFATPALTHLFIICQIVLGTFFHFALHPVYPISGSWGCLVSQLWPCHCAILGPALKVTGRRRRKKIRKIRRKIRRTRRERDPGQHACQLVGLLGHCNHLCKTGFLPNKGFFLYCYHQM